MDKQHIIKAIEDEAARSGRKPSTICQYAVQNRNFYDNLVKGLDCQIGTAQRVLDWIALEAAKPAAGVA